MTSFNPQVKGVGETRWIGNGCYFATAEEALAYVEDMQSRWSGCQQGADNRRAEPSGHVVNYAWNFEARKAYPVKP
jgi:hypothetical protein